jgi:hypothetical protein
MMRREGNDPVPVKIKHLCEITGAGGQGVRKIFAPERPEVTVGCRKLYNEEHHNL